MNEEQGEAESRSRGLLGLTVDLEWSELEIELCRDEAGDIERLRPSEAFCGKFPAPGGGGVGEKESLLFEDLMRIDCDVAEPWMEGVGEMESLLCIRLIGIGRAVAALWIEEGVGEIESLLGVCLIKTGRVAVLWLEGVGEMESLLGVRLIRELVVPWTEGVGEIESLFCDRLSGADCGVAAPCTEGGVGELDTLERGEGERELSLDLVRCVIRFEDAETWLLTEERDGLGERDLVVVETESRGFWREGETLERS